MYSKGKENLKAYFPACSEQIRCYQLLRPCWELLCPPSQLKRTQNNGRRWVHRDMTKSRKMILCTAVLKQLDTASCLSVSPSKKKWQSRPKYSVWCLPQLHIKDVGNRKPNQEFQTELFLQWPCKYSPQYSAVSSRHHHHLQKLLKDMTASLVSFQCCCRQAGRRPWVLFSDGRPHPFLLGKGSFMWNGSHAVSDARVRPGTYVEFCGLPQKSSSSSNGSDSDNNRERHTLKTPAVQGEHSCVAVLRVNS